MVRCFAYINPSSVAARMFFGFACEIVGVQPTKKNSARRFASRTALPQGKPKKRTDPYGRFKNRPHLCASNQAFPGGGRCRRSRRMRCHAQSNGVSRRRALQDCAKRAQTVMRGLAPAAPCAFTPPSLPERNTADAAREDAARRREKRPVVGERHARIARALLPCAHLALA